MRRIRFVYGVVMSLFLVSCGRSEQIPSDMTLEESKIYSDQEIQNNANQVIADYPEYEDAKSLVKVSDAIFSGTVLSITKEDLNITKGRDAEKLPYFIFKVKIDILYQGEVTEDVIKIKHLNTGVEEDALCIEEGIPYLFLVECYDDSYPSLVNADQSFFEMDVKQTKGVKKNSTNKEQKISFDDIMAVLSNN